MNLSRNNLAMQTNRRLFLAGTAAWAATRSSTASGETVGSMIDTAIYARWGFETLSMVRERFWDDQRKRYREQRSLNGRPDDAAAFMWSLGVHFTSLNAAAAIDPQQFLPQAIQMADIADRYWDEFNDISGYDVLPNPVKSDRYYDDNAWIALALMELYDLTDDQKYRQRAIATHQFVFSGRDEKLGGGLYWRERKLTSKNTCTNAPATVSALRLHQITGETQYLDQAAAIYRWVDERLKDDEDGLYFDSIKMDGTIDRRKFSYNTALMLRATVLLHQIEGSQSTDHLARAEAIYDSAVKRWITDDGGVRDSGRFAHLLLESFLTLRAVVEDDARRKSIDQTLDRCLRHLHSNVRQPNGTYNGNWSRLPRRRRRRLELLDQSSPARIYLLAAKELAD